MMSLMGWVSVIQASLFAHEQRPVWSSHSISTDFLSSPSPPSARLNPLHCTYRLRASPSSRTARTRTLGGSLLTEKQLSWVALSELWGGRCQWVFNGWRWAPPAAPDWTPVQTYCRWTSPSAMVPRCRWRRNVSSLSSSFTTTGWRMRRCWTGGRPYSSTCVTRRRWRVSFTCCCTLKFRGCDPKKSDLPPKQFRNINGRKHPTWWVLDIFQRLNVIIWI